MSRYIPLPYILKELKSYVILPQNMSNKGIIPFVKHLNIEISIKASTAERCVSENELCHFKVIRKIRRFVSFLRALFRRERAERKLR